MKAHPPKPKNRLRRRDARQGRRMEQARNIEMFIRVTREEMTEMLAALEIVVDELRSK